MADTTIKHFIFSRFFPIQDPKYPHDIYDVDFLSKQLPLAKNMLSSLENQTNKNFDLIFLMNEKFFDNPTYEFLFKTLQDSTTLPIKFVKTHTSSSGKAVLNEHSYVIQFDTLSPSVKDALNEYDYVIQSRMDFDDFAYKDAVADIQSKANDCDKVLVYGYCNGYDYRFKELYTYLTIYDTGVTKKLSSTAFSESDYKTQGVHSVLAAVILKSSFAKKVPALITFNVCQRWHSSLKPQLKDFLKKNGVEFSENMFQANMTTKAFIYFRHEFSSSVLNQRAGKLGSLKFPILTTNDITKKQLEDEFGFTGYELNSIK